jgi:serine/threonine protein kinase
MLGHPSSMHAPHRDLKPENFLLTSKTGPDAELKLTDFGLGELGSQWLC